MHPSLAMCGLALSFVGAFLAGWILRGPGNSSRRWSLALLSSNLAVVQAPLLVDLPEAADSALLGLAACIFIAASVLQVRGLRAAPGPA